VNFALAVAVVSSLSLGGIPNGRVLGPEWLTRPGEAPSLADQHVIFVAGFMNELIPGYFVDNEEAVRTAGGTSCTVYPTSAMHLEEDVTLLTKELDSHPGQSVTLFGHSKGGAAVLLTVLEHPEYVLDGRVRSVVVVQGAVGGSPLADALTFLGKKRKDGIHSLSSKEAHAAFAGALAKLDQTLNADQKSALFSRIFYVRAKHRKVVPAELAITAAMLDGQGENDGLVPVKDQLLEGVGVDLGVLEADHASLTVTGVMSLSSPGDRRAFTMALFSEMARRLGTGTPSPLQRRGPG